jgi:N-acyl-D-aspartate/D-glutamate deacylase
MSMSFHHHGIMNRSAAIRAPRATQSRCSVTHAASIAVAIIALATRPGATLAQAAVSVDVVVRGGLVVDGTGAPGRVTDVGIRGDRIVFIGAAATKRVLAKQSIDARGLVVVPGFIDPHAHVMGDLASPNHDRRVNAAYLMQGVTTTITGNDGGGPVDVGTTLAAWDKAGIGTNAAAFVGFGSVRQRLLGMSASAPSATQLDSMRTLVRRAMTAGALGMSTGLYYAPQSYASTEEVIALAKETAPDGVYDSHLRDESSYTIGLLGAVMEALRIGKEAGVAVNISHIKALGVDVWGMSDSVIALVRAAKRAGQRVTADQYPYTASGSSVGASLLPRWAEAGGRDSLRRRVADSVTHTRLEAEMLENLRRRGGAEALLITQRSRTEYVGKTLAEIARAKGESPIQAALEIILTGDASVASFNMQESDIANFMRQDFVMTGSDGSDGHPRKYGTFPRKFHTYVFGKLEAAGRQSGPPAGSRVLSLEAAVHQSSGLAAQTFGLTERGLIREGYFADVTVIDTAHFADQSTYQEPERLAMGVRFVWVNGTLAVSDGRPTGVLAGRALRRRAPAARP